MAKTAEKKVNKPPGDSSFQSLPAPSGNTLTVADSHALNLPFKIFVWFVFNFLWQYREILINGKLIMRLFNFAVPFSYVKICRRTKQTDRQTDGRTDRQTDGLANRRSKKGCIPTYLAGTSLLFNKLRARTRWWWHDDMCSVPPSVCPFLRLDACAKREACLRIWNCCGHVEIGINREFSNYVIQGSLP